MNKISKFIEVYNVNQRQAGKMLRVSPATISGWRSGAIPIPEPMANCIDLHLNIPVAHQKRLKELALK